MNGRPQLRRLRRALEARRPIPADVRDFVIDGLAGFEAGQKLDRALRVRAGPAVREARNAHLRRAFAAMPPHLSVSDCARRIIRASRNLEPMTTDPESEELIDGWQGEVLQALRLADLPGFRQLRAVGNRARDCQKSRV